MVIMLTVKKMTTGERRVLKHFQPFRFISTLLQYLEKYRKAEQGLRGKSAGKKKMQGAKTMGSKYVSRI